MPLLPTLEGSVDVAAAAAGSEPAVRGSERCWMMVLLTANLYGACDSADAFAGFDSEMRAERILPCASCRD